MQTQTTITSTQLSKTKNHTPFDDYLSEKIETAKNIRRLVQKIIEGNMNGYLLLQILTLCRSLRMPLCLIPPTNINDWANVTLDIKFNAKYFSIIDIMGSLCESTQNLFAKHDDNQLLKEIMWNLNMSFAEWNLANCLGANNADGVIDLQQVSEKIARILNILTNRLTLEDNVFLLSTHKLGFLSCLYALYVLHSKGIYDEASNRNVVRALLKSISFFQEEVMEGGLSLDFLRIADAATSSHLKYFDIDPMLHKALGHFTSSNALIFKASLKGSLRSPSDQSGKEISLMRNCLPAEVFPILGSSTLSLMARQLEGKKIYSDLVTLKSLRVIEIGKHSALLENVSSLFLYILLELSGSKRIDVSLNFCLLLQYYWKAIDNKRSLPLPIIINFGAVFSFSKTEKNNAKINELLFLFLNTEKIPKNRSCSLTEQAIIKIFFGYHIFLNFALSQVKVCTSGHKSASKLKGKDSVANQLFNNFLSFITILDLSSFFQNDNLNLDLLNIIIELIGDLEENHDPSYGERAFKVVITIRGLDKTIKQKIEQEFLPCHPEWQLPQLLHVELESSGVKKNQPRQQSRTPNSHFDHRKTKKNISKQLVEEEYLVLEPLPQSESTTSSSVEDVTLPKSITPSDPHYNSDNFLPVNSKKHRDNKDEHQANVTSTVSTSTSIQTVSTQKMVNTKPSNPGRVTPSTLPAVSGDRPEPLKQNNTTQSSYSMAVSNFWTNNNNVGKVVSTAPSQPNNNQESTKPSLILPAMPQVPQDTKAESETRLLHFEENNGHQNPTTKIEILRRGLPEKTKIEQQSQVANRDLNNQKCTVATTSQQVTQEIKTVPQASLLFSKENAGNKNCPAKVQILRRKAPEKPEVDQQIQTASNNYNAVSATPSQSESREENYKREKSDLLSRIRQLNYSKDFLLDKINNMAVKYPEHIMAINYIKASGLWYLNCGDEASKAIEDLYNLSNILERPFKLKYLIMKVEILMFKGRYQEALQILYQALINQSNQQGFNDRQTLSQIYQKVRMCLQKLTLGEIASLHCVSFLIGQTPCICLPIASDMFDISFILQSGAYSLFWYLIKHGKYGVIFKEVNLNDYFGISRAINLNHFLQNDTGLVANWLIEEVEVAKRSNARCTVIYEIFVAAAIIARASELKIKPVDLLLQNESTNLFINLGDENTVRNMNGYFLRHEQFLQQNFNPVASCVM